MSCRRAASLSSQHAASLRRWGHLRCLSYSSSERQSIAQRSIRNPSTYAPVSEGDGSTSTPGLRQDVVLGRYSRRPLTPDVLLSQVRQAPAPEKTDAAQAQHELRVSVWERMNGVQKSLAAKYRERGAYDAAWSELVLWSTQVTKEERSLLASTRSYDVFIKRVIKYQILSWVSSVERSLQPTAEGSSQVLLHANPNSDESEDSVLTDEVQGEATASLSHTSSTSNAPDDYTTPTRGSNFSSTNRTSSWEVSQVLSKLGLITPELWAHIIMTTFQSVYHPGRRTRDHLDAVLETALWDIVRIWHTILSTQLAPDYVKSQSLPQHKGEKSLNWDFLPASSVMPTIHLMAPKSVSQALNILMPSSDSLRNPYVEAVIATTRSLERSSASSANDTSVGEVHNNQRHAYRPLKTFFEILLGMYKPKEPRGPAIKHEIDSDGQSRVVPRRVVERDDRLSARRSNVSTDATQSETRTTNKDDISITEKRLELTESDPDGQIIPTKGDENSDLAEDQPVDDYTDRHVIPGATGDWIARCKTRMRRAVEKVNPALADDIFADVLQRITKLEYRYQCQLCQALVKMYTDMKLFTRALQVVEVMERLNVETAPVWTSLLRGTARYDDRTATDKVWTAIIERKVPLDLHAWTARVFSLINNKRPEAALDAMREMSSLWKTYADKPPSKNKQASNTATQDEESQSSHKPAKRPSHPSAPVKPHITVANAFLAGLVEHRDPKLNVFMPEAFKWIEENELKWDISTFNPVLASAQHDQDPKEVLQIMKMIKEQGIQLNAKTGRTVVHAIFHPQSDWGNDPEQRSQQVLEAIEDIETNYIGENLDASAYNVAIGHVLRRHGDSAAAEKLMARMRRQGVKITPAIYTGLLEFVLARDHPDLAALEALWYNIKYTDGLWGGNVDPILFDRALELMCQKHRIVGMQKILEILNHLPEMNLRPSWPALLAVAQVFVERGDEVRLKKLVENLHNQTFAVPRHGSRHHGRMLFWDYLSSIGIPRKYDEDGPKPRGYKPHKL